MTNPKSAGAWTESTLISSFQAASNVIGLMFKVPGWPGHLPGQHVDVRLTAPDGYMAERSYSIANAPQSGDEIELGVELLENGEVSPYLWTLKPGEKIEIRGPIGGHFIWQAAMPGPLVLIAGGSGMVPLMCMLRHHVIADAHKARPVIFIISLRTIDRLLYAKELEELSRAHANIKIVITLTESTPLDWKGYARRIDGKMFSDEIGIYLSQMPEVFICGPTKFVEAAAKEMIALGSSTHLIKTERFGG
jgi:ferredoxin-NADP reductase